jgi:GR25 family glycosyltransferase involved in LPS biosynthesis|tara:strand:+ start:281 stop:1012 length:732 start_codon:yes stop_codon:yes gene_type:complete
VKAFIITLKGIKESEKLAQKALVSAREHGYDASIFNAIKPKDNPLQIFRKHGIEPYGWIKDENPAALACWASHFILWKKSIEMDEPFLVLEHDAIVESKFPSHLVKRIKQIANLGAPGYIDSVSDIKNIEYIRKGLGRLRSNNKFCGTHGYIVTPGVDEIIEKMEVNGVKVAIDYYLSINRFPKLQEYLPWCISAESNFSTIQYEAPKHFDGTQFLKLQHLIDPCTGKHLEMNSEHDRVTRKN